MARVRWTRWIVASIIATLLVEAGAVAPASVVAAELTPPAVEQSAAAAPLAEPVPQLDPADEVTEARTATTATYDLGGGRYAVEVFPDPARAEENPYAYAANNPVTKVDPEGRAFWFAAILLVARVVVAVAPVVTGAAVVAPAAAALCQRACPVAVRWSHILRYHSASLSQAALRARDATLSGKEYASKFLSNRAISDMIRSAMACPTSIRWEGPVGRMPTTVVYAQRFRVPVGVDSRGQLLSWICVVVRAGEVVTAYPARQAFAP